MMMIQTQIAKKKSRYYDNDYFLDQLENAPKIPGRTYQKARRANNRTILTDTCTLKFFGPAPPPDYPRYKPQYDHFSAHLIPSAPALPPDPWHSECNPFCNQPMTHNNLMQFQELTFSSFITHNPTHDDDDSTHSDLDYFQ